LGRITKTGAGVLALNNATNSFSGGMTITDGAVSSSASSGSPLGTGPITLGGGNLVLTPPASGSNVVLTFGNLDYGPGAAMRLTRDNSIAANFGAINRQAGGTLVIDPVNSIDELGSAAANFVRVTGTGVTNNVNGGVPATNGDIASPSIIAKTSSGNPTGEFVRYGVNGFEKGTYSTSVNINTATVNDVFNATANQAIVTSASVFALNVRSGVTVSGGALNVGDGAHPATVILNGGSITASSLNFDTRQGILYSGGATTVTTGTISSNISGSGGVIKIGEANLRLNTASTFTGGLTIASGTFTTGASNVLPSTADVSLIGRGIVNTTTSPRLSLIGTSQTIASLGGNPGSTVDLGSGGTLIVSGSGDSQYRGAITGSTGSTLIKQGSGVLTLGETLSTSAIPSTTNGYQRLTMRNGGIVQVSSASSLPPALNPGMFPVLADTLRFDGGTLRISSINYSAINSGSTFVLASGTAQRGVTLAAGGGTIDVADPLETVLLQLDDLTARNIISGTGSLSKSGPGTLRLGPGNTFTGKTVVREGRLQFPADSALGAAPTMYVDDALQIHDGAMIQPTGAVVLNANRGITLVGGIGPLGPGEPAVINTSNGGCVVNSSITGSGALKKTGTSNSLVLNSLNDFSGDFVLEAGRVELNASGAAGSGSLVARPAFAVTLTTTAAADTSLFNDVQLDAGSTIEFDIPSSAGKLELLGNISGPNAFSKTGSGTMRLESQGSTFTGQTYVLAGTLLVSGPTGLGSSAGGTLVAPGAVLAFEGNVTHASAEPTYISGTGSGAGAIVNVSGDNVYGGNVTLNLDSTIGVTAGSLKIGRVSGGSILTKIGTGALTAEQFRTTGLTVSTTTVKIAQKAMIGDPADTSIVNNLAIAGGVTPTATLDITNNAVVVDYSTADAEPFDTIRAQIINAYNANAWNLPGITSTLAGGQFGIGYAEASALAAIPPVFGTVDSSAVLVRYTRYGDASLDGSVTLGDFNRLAANFGSSNTVWSQGDFNYDALVNLQDFNRLAANFGLSAGPDGPTPQDWATLASAVPEPSSAILLGLSAGPLMSRAARRRSQRRPQTR
jgi:autotransporter-associated beta strand protein